MSKINFSQLKEKAGDGSFPLLDPGVYELELKSAEFKIASTGSPMIAAQFVEPDTKIRIFENWVLTEKAAFRLFMFLKHTGIEAPSGDLDPESDEFEKFVDDLVGTEVTAKVKQETRTWQGEDRTNNVIESYVDGKAAKGPKRKKRTL